MSAVKQWCVAKAKPRNEMVLLSCLARWDIEAFFPMIRQPAPQRGKMEALFPTYVFCQMDPESSQWPLLRWAPGIAYVLTTDGKPSTLSDDLVEYLRQRVQSWNNGAEWHPPQQGEQVRVTAGPFVGMDGIFQRYIPSRERCQVLLDVIGGRVTVELPQGNIRSNGAALSIAS